MLPPQLEGPPPCENTVHSNTQRLYSTWLIITFFPIYLCTVPTNLFILYNNGGTASSQMSILYEKLLRGIWMLSLDTVTHHFRLQAAGSCSGSQLMQGNMQRWTGEQELHPVITPPPSGMDLSVHSCLRYFVLQLGRDIFLWPQHVSFGHICLTRSSEFLSDGSNFSSLSCRTLLSMD